MTGGVLAEASRHARDIDLFAISFGVLVVLLSAPVLLLMLYFAIRYRRGRAADRSHPMDRNLRLEIGWSVVPFLLILLFYVWSARMFFALAEPPADATIVNVVAKQWMWKFQQPSGAREINELHVPADTAIRLDMISEDVIHSLFLPALRIKADVLPGRYTSLWFNADKPGTYPLRCAEFCGTDHSVMGGQLIVMEPEAYASWLANAGTNHGLVAQGATLFRQLGCSGCHASGSAVHAPPLTGLYGSTVPLSDGRVVRADNQYLHDSILQPNRDVAAGYASIMPTYAKAIDEQQVVALQAYIRSLVSAAGGEHR